MTDDRKNDNSIIPISSNNIVRVGSSIEITNKIINEHEERSVSKNLNERNIELQDIMPLSLLYRDEKTNEFHTIIEEGTTIPTSKTISIQFKFQSDNSIYMKLFQGNLLWAEENKVIANLIIENVLDKSNDFLKCDFTFDIDKNGILNITVKDSKSGKFQNVKFQGLFTNDIPSNFVLNGGE